MQDLAGQIFNEACDTMRVYAAGVNASKIVATAGLPIAYVEFLSSPQFGIEAGTTHHSLADLADQAFEFRNGSYHTTDDVAFVVAIHADGSSRKLPTTEAIALCNRDRDDRDADQAADRRDGMTLPEQMAEAAYLRTETNRG